VFDSTGAIILEKSKRSFSSKKVLGRYQDMLYTLSFLARNRHVRNKINVSPEELGEEKRLAVVSWSGPAVQRAPFWLIVKKGS
jgi:hypothetical protein